MRFVDLSKHAGYRGTGSPSDNLENGENGVGLRDWKYDGDREVTIAPAITIVACCSNCGDYSWVGEEDIKEALRLGRAEIRRRKARAKRARA